MTRPHFHPPSLHALAGASAAIFVLAACASPDAPTGIEHVRAARGEMDAGSAPRPPIGVWQERTTLGPVMGAGITFDRENHVVMLFGGLRAPGVFLGDTWQWDGARWLRVHPPTSPPPRAMTAMAYDESRHRTVLFSGVSFNPLADTWEWDGTTWTARGSISPPAARQHHRMAFDPVERKVLLFGGWSLGDHEVLGDTWTWNGTTWEEVADGSWLNDAAMALDRDRGMVVRFGGHDPSYQKVDTTAVWDGRSWTPLDLSAAPPPRFGAALTFDDASGALVLFGGRGTTTLDDTWQLKGTTWSPVATESHPAARSDSAMAWDGERVLLAGGADADTNALDDTWSWDGTWAKSTLSNPPSAMHPGLAYDEARERVVLFGGFDGASTPFAETWEWDGDWRQRGPAHSPPARYAHAMTYDAERHVSVVFGGRAPGKVFGDTWIWDGFDWQERKPQHSPAARWDAAMAYDHDRQRSILHGGTDAIDSIGDETWAWDGNDWEQLPVKGPGIRAQHAIADHRARKQLVLFGGVTDMASNDTWIWDGEGWSPSDTDSAPTARSYHAMTYNRFRERVILFGGLLPGTATFSDVWEWDGDAWSAVTKLNGPGEMARGAFTFAERERGALFFGGSPPGPPFGLTSDATWLYRTRGGSCTTDAECDTQHCAISAGAAMGVCCEDASCPVCYSCDTDASPGVCAPAPEETPCGEPVSCGDGFVKPYACNGTGVCAEKECIEYLCENTADCAEGLTCSAQGRCVLDAPFPPPDSGCCVLTPSEGERSRGSSVPVALAMLMMVAARPRRRSVG